MSSQRPSRLPDKSSGGWLPACDQVDRLVVSQVWNDDCGVGTCPTRLVRLEPDGRRTVLVDDMMHQVIPPNDPRFAELPKTGPQAAYARHPFRLSDDGKTLLNGDFTFGLAGGKP